MCIIVIRCGWFVDWQRHRNSRRRRRMQRLRGHRCFRRRFATLLPAACILGRRCLAEKQAKDHRFCRRRRRRPIDLVVVVVVVTTVIVKRNISTIAHSLKIK